jgi:hypothetical protein
MDRLAAEKKKKKVVEGESNWETGSEYTLRYISGSMRLIYRRIAYNRSSKV